MTSISPQNFEEKMKTGGDPYILDVRDQEEIDQYRLRIDNIHYISMSKVLKNAELIPMNRSVIVICQLGGRCERVAKFLRTSGYDAENLEGGLDAWIKYEKEKA